MNHYVYYLYDADGKLLYIGRSQNPSNRRQAFIKRTGIEAVLGPRQRFSDISKACAAELAAIVKHQPPFNSKLISSRGRCGMTNSREHNLKVSAATKGRSSPTKGRPRSEETRLKISLANQGRVGPMLGKKFTDEHKAKISAALTGRVGHAKNKKYTAEHCAAIRAGRLKQEKRKRELT